MKVLTKNKQKNQKTKVKEVIMNNLNPSTVLQFIGDDENKKWEAMFCKVLITKECPTYSYKISSEGIIEATITNRHGFTFKVAGSNWCFVCFSVGKYMSDYFDMKDKNDLNRKMKRIIDILKKQ